MLKLIIMIVIGILILSFFGISLRTLVFSPTAQDNFTFAWQYVLLFWNWLIAAINNAGNSVQHIF
jgi:hypothetical protein